MFCNAQYSWNRFNSIGCDASGLSTAGNYTFMGDTFEIGNRMSTTGRRFTTSCRGCEFNSGIKTFSKKLLLNLLNFCHCCRHFFRGNTGVNIFIYEDLTHSANIKMRMGRIVYDDGNIAITFCNNSVIGEDRTIDPKHAFSAIN